MPDLNLKPIFELLVYLLFIIVFFGALILDHRNIKKIEEDVKALKKRLEELSKK